MHRMQLFSRHHLASLAALLLGGLLLSACTESNPGSSDSSAEIQQVPADASAVVLSIPNMDCPLCAPTVRRALSRVDGVLAVETDTEQREAKIHFDATRTDLESLIATIENAGFPTTPKPSEADREQP